MTSNLVKGLAIAGLALGSGTAMAASQKIDNPYPTDVIADYVFGCMATNGQTREALHKCSCSIDIISNILPYEKYIDAETVMRLRLKGGEKTAVFRDAPQSKQMVADLKRAQAEAEIRCFEEHTVQNASPVVGPALGSDTVPGQPAPDQSDPTAAPAGPSPGATGPAFSGQPGSTSAPGMNAEDGPGVPE